MNERIRAAWIKAAREDSDPDNWDTQEQFIERFAALIIKEAADIASSFQYSDIQDRDVRYTILEHFEVE